MNEAAGVADPTYYENFIRSPQAPFLANATLDVYDYSSFTNNGAGVTWIPFDPGGTDYHSVTTMVDPLTGLPRLIFGNDQGVWTILDNNGTFETQVGPPPRVCSSALPPLNWPAWTATAISRSPSSTTVRPSPAAPPPRSPAPCSMAAAQDNGGPVSDPNILTDGNITWSGPDRRRHRRGHRPAGTGQRLTSTSGPAAAATTPTSSSTSAPA